MSTLEKIIHLLSNFSERQLDIVYSLVQFLDSQKENVMKRETVEDILRDITGVLQDSGKNLTEYQTERIKDRYEFLIDIDMIPDKLFSDLESFAKYRQE